MIIKRLITHAHFFLLINIQLYNNSSRGMEIRRPLGLKGIIQLVGGTNFSFSNVSATFAGPLRGSGSTWFSESSSRIQNLSKCLFAPDFFLGIFTCYTKLPFFWIIIHAIMNNVNPIVHNISNFQLYCSVEESPMTIVWFDDTTIEGTWFLARIKTLINSQVKFN